MLSRYVNVTSDTSLLPRALPLAEAELAWWHKNRTIFVKSPYTGKDYPVSHYAAINTAPRPESYLEDYQTVNGVPLGPGSSVTDLNGLNYTEQQRADMYSEIASGAETGWDFTSRFTKDPFATLANTTNQEPLMRGLNVRATVAVDLNSIICGSLYTMSCVYVWTLRLMFWILATLLFISFRRRHAPACQSLQRLHPDIHLALQTGGLPR